jgi:hypothetical protein
MRKSLRTARGRIRIELDMQPSTLSLPVDPITTIAVTVPAASSFNLLMPLLPIRDFKGWEDDGIPGAVSAQCAPSDTAFLPLTQPARARWRRLRAFPGLPR